MTLLVVASVAYDGIETPSGSVDRVLGGSGPYIALAASHFCGVQLVAVVGDDFAAEDEAVLRRPNIDLQGLARSTGKTFYWKGTYSEDMNERRTIVTELNVFADFDPKLPEPYQDTRHVLLGNIQPTLQRSVLSQVTAAAFVGGDTMNYWIERTPSALGDSISGWNVALINDEEARMLSGARDLRLAARRIQAMGPGAVVIKRGGHGAALFDGDDCFMVPGYPLESLVDPTGAGDAFAGGFMGYLASQNHGPWAVDRGEVLRKAMVYGSVTGSYCCEGFGVSALQALSRDMVDRRYARLSELADR